MIVFIAFYILLAGLLGFRIFRGTVEGSQYFSDYVDSSFNMLVLLTTSNYPDIMLPAYEYSRLTSLFFVIYLMIGVFLIMNLLMALFYSNYMERLTNQMKAFHEERDKYLEEKFDELD
jgi:Ion transport protein